MGNINKLTDNPIIAYCDKSSNFIDWMEEQMGNRGISDATKLNHKACIRLLRWYNNQLSFSDINSSTLLEFNRFLRVQHYKQNTNRNFPDALSGAALCGTNGSVLLLADDKSPQNAGFAGKYKNIVDNIYIFGGPNAVGDIVLQTLTDSLK